ncbi:hypothetical protein [Candidatus Poriferisocius sp.]|uniref:hypothetical protein n=1 Tax=Candidatus Poriferisocius sp. TaxID=3101276 RepID=UPI003B5BDB3E
MSTAERVRERIENAPVRSFIQIADLAGPRRAVECELSRLVAKGDVARVRRGLYWKGPRTPVGVPLPRAFDVGMEVAGPGAGPAGATAAAYLGLTTQVPAIETIAVPGRVPSPVDSVRFVGRSIERRVLGLEATEIAVLELLREGPTAIETPWSDFTEAVARLIRDALVRPNLISQQLTHERHIAARQRWSDLH